MENNNSSDNSFGDKVVDITRTRINLKQLLAEKDPIEELLNEFPDAKDEDENVDDVGGELVEKKIERFCDSKHGRPTTAGEQLERDLLFLEETIRRINYYIDEIETSLLD
ncbi:MAG: hypothetical protein A2504_01280 [Bdellovibrionales bacterium RIFOXYD12_FULL_39_22]|nr:MAG: hypothetical protein A2385_02170 [Bdellovibrionales bacterium RIFOXYB1_FULL_39_21]OFZ42740.1 MAG: hypothetical protein A2485_10355 [Bdellovibrionales bacterium RIFOXYC12_FULL_39_17]OFZ47299.1 MAG: hypothetical protein A2404_14960 [Bdellovibrionales bacterium RIFOXYC1_FULL_39_130]OFZ71427.1 MAG: hypothetical protein A2451_10760 [Bdellovibrionales bacterium RIFOXYC2_FULL_39_8]OFZ75465.1 MAG: hypothetical protein A2560_04230 [Bdellovibrionales bacterium RIFOXYD1_FULL_39_84]OFZ93419.1 MAG: